MPGEGPPREGRPGWGVGTERGVVRRRRMRGMFQVRAWGPDGALFCEELMKFSSSVKLDFREGRGESAEPHRQGPPRSWSRHTDSVRRVGPYDEIRILAKPLWVLF